MPSKRNSNDPHIDWSRLGKKTRAQINAEAAAEKRTLGLSGTYKRFTVYIDGVARELPIPDVKAIRERLHLSQADFARRFGLSQRTVQQWEQRRAVPDMPARILLKAIENSPGAIEAAAAQVASELLNA